MSFEDNNFTATGDINGPALATAFAIEAVVAFIANTIVLAITMYQRKSWKQPSTIFFTSLIMSNLVSVLVYLPMTAIATGAGEWIFGSTLEEREATCVFVGLIFWLNVFVTTATLAAISFDRFLFNVKPHLHKRFMRSWVALTLTITIWMLSVLLLTLPLLGFGEYMHSFSYGQCITLLSSRVLVGSTLTIMLIFVIVIAVTSIWTFYFTCRFIRGQSAIAGESVYTSRKRRLFGIFASMLIAYTLCYVPSLITGNLKQVLQLHEAVSATNMFTFQFITIASPLIQLYFRLDIKNALTSSKKVVCSKLRKKKYFLQINKHISFPFLSLSLKIFSFGYTIPPPYNVANASGRFNFNIYFCLLAVT